MNDEVVRGVCMSEKQISNKEIYANLYNVQRKITRTLSRTKLKKFDLTYSQFLVLNDLWIEEPLLVTTIVRDLGLDTGTISPLLKRMEEKDLIKKERSNIDQRKVYVHLTEKGKQLDSELEKVVKSDNAIPELSADETVELNRLLKKIVD